MARAYPTFLAKSESGDGHRTVQDHPARSSASASSNQRMRRARASTHSPASPVGGEKKPQALAHCGLRVRKLIVYERAPGPGAQS